MIIGRVYCENLGFYEGVLTFKLSDHVGSVRFGQMIHYHCTEHCNRPVRAEFLFFVRLEINI